MLCPSIALEGLRGVRQQRALARKLAASGVTTLRFAFQGTDNSSGHSTLDGLSASLLPEWRAAVLRAIEIAREHSHCSRVVVVGRRVGALLALVALRDASAQLRAGVELVLWDPVSSGHSFLRDLRIRERLRASVMPELMPIEDANAPIQAIEQTFEFNRSTLRDLSALKPEGPLPKNMPVHVVTARLDRAMRTIVETWPADSVTVHTATDAAFNLDLMEGPELPGLTFNAIGGIVSGGNATNDARVPTRVRDAQSANHMLNGIRDCSEALELPELHIQEKWMCVNEATSLKGLLTVPYAQLPDANNSAARRSIARCSSCSTWACCLHQVRATRTCCWHDASRARAFRYSVSTSVALAKARHKHRSRKIARTCADTRKTSRTPCSSCARHSPRRRSRCRASARALIGPYMPLRKWLASIA